MIFLKTMRVLIKSSFFICLALSLAVFSSILYLEQNINKDYKVRKGEELEFNSSVPITAVYNGAKLSQSTDFSELGDQYEVDLKIFGIIPFSSVNVQIVDELQVAVLGHPFGMKLYTEGVLVSEVTEVITPNGVANPAAKAGIKKGDYIISVNGEKVYTNEDLSAVVENSKGESMNFKILRNKTKINLKVRAEISKENGRYKIGLWVKDSSAGIGTLTFYSPATNIVCGLGHGICDDETGNLLNLNSGEIVEAEILSVEKGNIGAPGKLNGRFLYKSLGKIDLNCNGGVYSGLKGKINTERLYEVAFKREIENGEAQILCTIEGDKPQLYSCKVELRASAFLSKTQNMIVTITDKKLLSLTGGIVQGMSGSPLIQNGKLIGAVTHVLVDDPTKGYAIFAENMLETAQLVSEQQLKEAS